MYWNIYYKVLLFLDFVIQKDAIARQNLKQYRFYVGSYVSSANYRQCRPPP